METDTNRYWLLGIILSVVLHVSLVVVFGVDYFAEEVEPPMGAGAPFALYIGPLQSAPDTRAAKPISRPKPKPKVEVEKKALPKLAQAVKPKIVVDKKEKEPAVKKPQPEPEPEVRPLVEDQPDSDNPNEHPDSIRDDGGDSAYTSYGNSGPLGAYSSAPVIGTSYHAGKAGAIESWNSILFTHINKYKRYPKEAYRLSRPTGLVEITTVIDSKGVVLSAKLSKGSGNIYLDRAAQNLLHRASPVPAPPASLLNEDRQVVAIVPIRYENRR